MRTFLIRISRLAKDETVYVKLNPDGSTKKIIVSDWLKNPDKTASIEDARICRILKMSKARKLCSGQRQQSFMEQQRQ